MPRDLQPTRMRSINGGLQFLRSDEHICLERSDILVGPIIHRSGGVGRTREWMQLMDKTAGAFQVRSGYVEVRPRRQPTVDRLFDIQVGIGLNAACGARRSDSGSKI